METKQTYRVREIAGVMLKEANVYVGEAYKSFDEPQQAANFWRENIQHSARFTPGVENFVILFVNTRRKLTDFQILSTGTLDTILVHPREVFRAAIVASASAIILMHNHPSGDPTPSEADIKVTRDLIRAGQLLKIEVLDHVIVGTAEDGRARDYMSLRELGYFYA